MELLKTIGKVICWLPCAWIALGTACLWAEPITVGASFSSTGKYAEPSRMIRIGYEMWVDQINAKGGLLGRQVRLVLYDDQSNLDKVKTYYQALIETDRVDLLLSPYGSPATMAASDISEASRYVMIACAAASEKVYSRGYQYLFGLYASADRYCIGFLDLLARNGISRTAVVYEQSAFHESIYEGFRRWSDIFGIETVLSQSFPPGDPKFGAIVDALQKVAPEALVMTAYPPQGYDFLKSLEMVGYRPPELFLTIAPIHPNFYRKAGPIAEGIFGPSNWEPIESIPFPGTQQFVRDFVDRTGYLPSYHATAAYAACHLLERAVIETTSLDHDKIREFIFRLDTVSIMGRFKVDETGQQVGHNPMLIQWQQGQKEIVYPAKMRTAAPIFHRQKK